MSGKSKMKENEISATHEFLDTKISKSSSNFGINISGMDTRTHHNFEFQPSLSNPRSKSPSEQFFSNPHDNDNGNHSSNSNVSKAISSSKVSDWSNLSKRKISGISPSQKVPLIPPKSPSNLNLNLISLKKILMMMMMTRRIPQPRDQKNHLIFVAKKSLSAKIMIPTHYLLQISRMTIPLILFTSQFMATQFGVKLQKNDSKATSTKHQKKSSTTTVTDDGSYFFRFFLFI